MKWINAAFNWTIKEVKILVMSLNLIMNVNDFKLNYAIKSKKLMKTRKYTMKQK